MGEVLIAGTASLLMCVFLSPKFISWLREREFQAIVAVLEETIAESNRSLTR